MPTYEYRCDACDQTFDVVQSFSDDPLSVCPTCGSPVRKVFGNVGIVFKGSGFYKTDSRTGRPASAGGGAPTNGSDTGGDGGGSGGSGGSDGSSSSNGDGGSSEAAPAAKTPGQGSEGSGGSGGGNGAATPTPTAST